MDRNQVVTRRRANCVTSSTGRYGDSGCRTDGRTVRAFGRLGSVGPAKGHFRLTSYCSLRTRKFINRLFFHRRTRFGDQVVERSGRNIDFPAELLVVVGVSDTRLVLQWACRIHPEDMDWWNLDIVNGLDLAWNYISISGCVLVLTTYKVFKAARLVARQSQTTSLTLLWWPLVALVTLTGTLSGRIFSYTCTMIIHNNIPLGCAFFPFRTRL